MSDKDTEKTKQESKKTNLKYLIFLHINIILYSVVGVLCKVAANAAMVSGLISFEVITIGALIFVVLAIYAYFYQKIIKVMDLTVAYANRSLLTLWTLVWAILLFNEAITIGNIIGSLIIVLGIWLVVQGDE